MSPDPRFTRTRWSMVVLAAKRGSGEAEAALADLCEKYWVPLYAFARRRGSGPEEAADLVQGFFAALLEKEYLRDADPERGRFRTFLLTAFRHFASKEHAKANAIKRGGGRRKLSLDIETGEGRFLGIPVDDRTPEKDFERRYALTLLDQVLERLAASRRAAGKEAQFNALRPFLAGVGPIPTHEEVARRLGMTENAVAVAIHRLKRRYREALRAAVAETVSDPAEIDDEIRSLIRALSSS